MKPNPIEKQEGAYHHGNLRRALIDAALELIASHGPENLSLRAVARRAGVSTAAPYRHFESREALLAAVAEEGFRALSESIERAAAPHTSDPIARLVESGVGYVSFAAAHPSHYRVMFMSGAIDGAAYPECQVAAAHSLSLLLDAIRNCQDAGLIRPDDPNQLAVIAWSIVHGLALLIGSGQIAVLGLDPSDVRGLSRYVGEAIIRGVAPPARG